MLKSLISLIRPKHWIKNAFVIMPLVFSIRFTEIDSIYLVLQAFVSFCFIASSVYVLNDIVDKEKDKKHPKKKHRPIASGEISLITASILGIFLFIFACLIAHHLNIKVLSVILLYFFVNVAYSLKFKHYVILDVFIIAFGFILRVYAGSFALNANVSHWIILTTFFISLFLGFSKRLNELNSLSKKEEHRYVLAFYSEELLHHFLMTAASLTIMSYALYTIDPKVILKYGTDNLIYSVPIVVFGIFRYLYLLFQKKEGGDVAETILRDKIIILTCVFWLTSTITILFFKL